MQPVYPNDSGLYTWRNLYVLEAAMTNEEYLMLLKRIEKLESLAHEHIPENHWYPQRIKPMIKVTTKHIEKCEHVWADYLLLAFPPKRQCVKCNFIETLGSNPKECSETLSFCEHGMPVKFKCDLCDKETKCK